MTLSLTINAATGRMGKELLKAAVSDSEVSIGAALARANHPLLGSDIGYFIGANPQGKSLSADLSAAIKESDVLIDFSLPEYSIATLQQAVANNQPVIIGTTGFNQAQQEQIQQAATQIPVMLSANYSLGVNSLIKLVKETSRLLGKQADIEIFEAHHKHKLDAPSGTALAIGEAIAETKACALEDIAVYERSCERKSGDIGFSVMRAGEIVGTHEVTFALDGELLSLRHEAQSRQCFAQGAIEAAKWLHEQAKQGKNGLFSMQDYINR